MSNETNSQQNGMIRVVDSNGHLLFKYDPHTQCIEIKVPVGRSSDNGSKYRIDTTFLRSAGFRNVISDVPQWTFTAELVE